MSIFSNLGHWASNTWDHNRNFVGNALKNVAPALVFVPGLGMVAAGAAGAAGRAMQKGSNFGDILKQGVTSAAEGGGARALVGGVQGALSAAGGGGGTGVSAGVGASPGASAGAGLSPGVPSALTGPLPGYALTPGSGGVSSAVGAIPAAAPSAGGGFSLGGAAKALGGFAKDNAAVIGQTGSGLLNARETGMQNDLKQQQLSFEQQQYADEQARKKRLSDLMAPLYGQLAASQQAIPAYTPYNPYGKAG